MERSGVLPTTQFAYWKLSKYKTYISFLYVGHKWSIFFQKITYIYECMNFYRILETKHIIVSVNILSILLLLLLLSAIIDTFYLLQPWSVHCYLKSYLNYMSQY